ncbi:MAG: molybdopterin molybdotransferase MoeA [Cohaesibacter sp.]|jgi:molybdopterin molybdotransferase|nr:molybdopterin molybdotransferase MoeA [Cohaesibacter sp.]
MAPTTSVLDDCFLHDKDRLRHEEAIEILKTRLSPIATIETIPLLEACGRVLAEEITAPRNVPLTDNSAVDGYAFAHSDYVALDGKLPISQRIAAGDMSPSPLAAGTAARIFTGAMMPQGADSVAMQEDCSLSSAEDSVSIPPGLKDGANRRKAGEDLREGEILFGTGTRLRAPDCAALASIGTAEIKAFKPLRIAMVSTGDEIIRPGAPIKPGQVYDANQSLILGLLSAHKVDVTDLGVWPDDGAEVEARLRDAAGRYDLILTSGGASRGEEDHIIQCLDKIGQRHMWQLAIKPGRPMSFAHIRTPSLQGAEGDNQKRDCVVLGLPGNPVAVMVCFALYVRLVIQRLGGMTYKEPVRFSLPAAFEIGRKKPDRREFLRGMLVRGEDGTVSIDKYARDGSGLISSLRKADGLIEIPEETTSVTKGEMVSFLPFSQLDIL